MSMFAHAIEPDGTTHCVKMLQTIAGLMGPAAIGKKRAVFLTSSDWGLLAREIANNYAASLLDPTTMPDATNFKSAIISGVMFVNSGTEDQDVVNHMNAQAFRLSGGEAFAWNRDNWIAGRA